MGHIRSIQLMVIEASDVLHRWIPMKSGDGS
jgi:hypothetical protein